MPRRPTLGTAKRIAGEVLVPTIFFVVGIDLMSLLMHLMSSPCDIDVMMIVAISVVANLTAKAIVFSNFLPFVTRLDRLPLIWPMMLRGLCYYVVIVLLRLAEHMLLSLKATGNAFDRLFAHVTCSRKVHPAGIRV